MKPKPLPVFLTLDAVDYKAVIPAGRFAPAPIKRKAIIKLKLPRF